MMANVTNKRIVRGATAGTNKILIPKKLLTQFKKAYKAMVALERGFANV